MNETLTYLTKTLEALWIANDAYDVVDCCCEISRQFGIELTLAEGEALMEHAQEVCPEHPESDFNDGGHCLECEKPA